MSLPQLNLPTDATRRVRYVRNLENIPNIPPGELEKLKRVSERYVFRANDYYTGRVVKLRFVRVGGAGKISERQGAFVFKRYKNRKMWPREVYLGLINWNDPNDPIKERSRNNFRFSRSEPMNDNVILHRHLQASLYSGQIGKLFR